MDQQLVTQLVSAAVIGAASPVAAMATIAVLATENALRNALAILAGWTTLLLLLALGMRLVLGEDGAAVDSDVKSILNLVLGQVLLSVAVRNLIGARHPLTRAAAGDASRPDAPPGDIPARTAAPRWMRALDELTLPKAFGIGMVLLAASPANIALYLGTLPGVWAYDPGDGQLLILALLILAIDLCILIPLAIYVAVPRRSQRLLATGRVWLIDHQRALTSWVLLAFGGLLTLSGVADLA